MREPGDGQHHRDPEQTEEEADQVGGAVHAGGEQRLVDGDGPPGRAGLASPLRAALGDGRAIGVGVGFRVVAGAAVRRFVPAAFGDFGLLGLPSLLSPSGVLAAGAFGPGGVAGAVLRAVAAVPA